MAAYTVEFTAAAVRDLAELPRDVLRRVDARIGALAREPRPAGIEKLVGSASLYRVRVGDYRIIYEITDRLLVVTITRVRHRREVYRRP